MVRRRSKTHGMFGGIHCMWLYHRPTHVGFQPRSRSLIERLIGETTSQIELLANGQLVLVGFAPDGSLRHPLCIEPEVAFLSANHLDAVLLRTLELLKADSQVKDSNQLPSAS